MTRKLFEEQIEQLKQQLIEMGNLNTEAIADAVTALETQDVELAQKTKGVETLVRRKGAADRAALPQAYLKAAAGRQRLIVRHLRHEDDHRHGAHRDQAVDISELVIKMSKLPYAESLTEIPQMADRVQAMVHNATKSFVDRDGELAKAVCRADDAVDDLFDTIKRKLTGIIHKDIDDDDNGEQALDLLMIAKYLEKIGDHASNIAEWVIFMLTGEHKKLN